MHPQKIISVVALAVVTGTLQLDSLETEKLVSRSLTPEQRIKLAEALTFIIKRRAVVEEYVPMIIALMTFGDDSANYSSDGAEDSLFRSETHKYFIVGEKQDVGESSPSKKEIWEEKDIRLNTGGPIFQSEELHVVRAARASVLSALVSKSSPQAIAPTCKFLVRLINDALALEPSRSVCRAVTTLARELYELALRELDEVLASLAAVSTPMVSTRASIPFTVALISSDEEVLRSGLVAKSTFGRTTGQHTLDDPATSARCKEALTFRQRAEDSGLFFCAKYVFAQGLSALDYPQLLRIVKANAHNGVELKLSMPVDLAV